MIIMGWTMQTSQLIISFASRMLPGDQAGEILEAIGRLSATGFDGNNSDRIAAAIITIAARGVRTKEVIALAQRDYRDLLISAGLANEDWPDELSKLLQS